MEPREVRFPYIVTCRYSVEEDTYRLFLHEADMLLIVLGAWYEGGKLTAAQARELWKPYRDICPGVYDLEEWEGGRLFPVAGGDYEFLPGTIAFEDEVDALEIDGAGYVAEDLTPNATISIQINGVDALQHMGVHIYPRYRMVVLDGTEPADWSESPEACWQVIAWARRRAGLPPI